jgi:hypothetical protein
MASLSNTIRFLRMAASELRRLAERIPEIADELELMAASSKPKRTIWRPSPGHLQPCSGGRQPG